MTQREPTFIHPTACVDPRARIGEGCRIGAFAVVEDGAVLGDGCVVMAHGIVHGNATLGDDCVVHPSAVIGGDPQDLSWKEGGQRVVVGHRCVFREGVTIHRSKYPEGATRIGDDGLFMANSHVAHDCVIGNKVILANSALLAGHVEVGDRALLSGNTAVHQFTRIGKLAMLSGLSGAVQDIAPFLTVAGGRSVVRGVNLIGMKRAGYDEAQRRRVMNVYKEWFAAPSVSEGAGLLADLASKHGEIAEIYAFVSAASPRGFARPDPDHPLSADRG